MASSVKIAVSLPADLLREAEAERDRIGETRSALVQRALRLLLAEKEKRRRRRAYVEGYGRHPETPREIEAAESASARLFAGEPWD